MGDYNLYLQSAKWGHARQHVWYRCGGKCERCGFLTGAAMEHCHHMHYRNLFFEEIDDYRSLLGICRKCHEFLHHRSQFDPLAPIPTIEELLRRNHDGWKTTF
jgi:hypothetical protein